MPLKHRLSSWRFWLETGRRLFFPHAIRSEQIISTEPPFFIVSNGRSGTTLLRAMLIQSPVVHIPPEFKLIRSLSNQYSRILRHLPWEIAVYQFGAIVAEGPTLLQWGMSLENFYRRANLLPPAQRSLANLIDLFYLCHGEVVKPGAVRWGDKTPRNLLNLDRIDNLFPGARIIHLLRDGRDVVASIYGLEWHSSLEDTCDAWLRNISKLYAYPHRNNKKKFLEVRYETLVSEPQSVMREICEFIELPYEAEMLNFYEHRDKLGFEGTQAHHSGLRRPLNASSIGSWRNRLDANEQRYVMERIGPTIAELGYSL